MPEPKPPGADCAEVMDRWERSAIDDRLDRPKSRLECPIQQAISLNVQTRHKRG